MAAPQPASAAPVDFREGEAIDWLAMEPVDPAPDLPHYPASVKRPYRHEMRIRSTTRPVIFEKFVDERYANVRFGTNTQRVLIAELRRPALPEPRQQQPASTPIRHTVDLVPLRDALRQRLAEAHTAVKSAAEAAGAADRADTALREAQATLARFAEHDRTAAARFVDALRKGTTDEDPHGPANTADREAAHRRCDAAQQAAVKLTAELAAARAAAREADARIHTAVRAVIVGVAQREGDVLERLEVEVANRRASLRALARYRPAVLTGAAPSEIALPGRILTMLNPAETRPGSATGTPWANLYTSLLTDPEADIKTPAASVAG